MTTRAITARMIALIFFDGSAGRAEKMTGATGAMMRPSIETRRGGISDRSFLSGASSFCFNVLLGLDVS